MPEDRKPGQSGRGRRDDKPRQGGAKSSSSSQRSGSGGGRPTGRSGERSTAGRGRSGESSNRSWSRDRPDDRRRDDVDRSVDQKRYDGPEIPDDITGKELDRSVMAQLKSLPEKLGLRVARHLVAAGQLLETDPKTAYEHTLAARARASRLAVVREAVGEAAYAAGEYSTALAELRAAKRMNGAQDYIAIMADCERALGKPDRALAMLQRVSKDKFAPALVAEVAIVEAGARADRKEWDAALRTLENANINSKSREPWVARVRYAYADTLLAAGRTADALEWFHRTEAVDTDEATDAAARAAEVERLLGTE